MAGFTLQTTVDLPYAETVERVRAGLGDQGFGVLTEIDLAATLKAKLDVDLAPEVILGACRPPLAYAAVQADPSVAALLPCNVVVRSVGESSTVVEAFDPAAMMAMSDSDALEEMAADAGRRIRAMLDGLGEPSPATGEETEPRRG